MGRYALMTPDVINGVFEFCGSFMTWMGIRQLLKDRGHTGIYVPTFVFFTSWGLWNLFYYPHLDQWASFLGGCSLVIANVTQVVLMLHFGRKEQK